MTEISIERIAGIEMAELIESASGARRLDERDEQAPIAEYDPVVHGAFSRWSRQVVRQAVRKALTS